MDDTYCVFLFMSVSSEIYKTNDKNKCCCKTFLLQSFLIQIYFLPVLKTDLPNNLSIFHFSDSMRIIQNSCVIWKFYLSINTGKHH